ncbi:MAG TPA: DEAD/DEAH box helicase [Pyrinomonadaceae bacterium]|nr:DEAD/DEAH box helicase [Pyrinomonadaceae bacterium]
MNFAQLGLAREQSERCESLEYFQPTPVQTQAIPIILSGLDLIGSAETGTGKTAAFLLPIIQNLNQTGNAVRNQRVRALILAPTRELASQIQKNYSELNSSKANRSVTVIGGAAVNGQVNSLRRGATVVIATPGRLLDLVERRAIDLSHVEILVLDEADRMLDMGFLPAIRRVLSLVPENRQTLLFSATLSSEVEKLARAHMKQPRVVEVNPRGRAARLIEQTAYSAAPEHKTALLLDLLERENFERVLVFTRTRRGAERLSHILSAREHSVNRIHADRTQSQRETALLNFREGRTRILVATDIAARGIDVEAVSHVINYDVPAAPEDYVHRIGRTGRAGTPGRAITIVTPVDEFSMRGIEQLTGETVKRISPSSFGGRPVEVAQQRSSAYIPKRAALVRSFRPRRASR